LDKDYLETEQFWDLLIQAIEESSKTRHLKKIDLYAKVLSGSISNINDREYSEEYLKTLTELNIKEIQAIKIIFSNFQNFHWSDSKNIGPLVKLWDKIRKDLLDQMEEMMIPVALSRLEKAALLSEVTSGYMDYSGGCYMITPYCKKIVEFILKENE
jgi:hypothetical protein